MRLRLVAEAELCHKMVPSLRLEIMPLVRFISQTGIIPGLTGILAETYNQIYLKTGIH